MNANVNRLKSWNLKNGCLTAVVVAAGLLSQLSTASAMTPVATGRVLNANGGDWATLEVFETSSNAFGFFFRIRHGGDRVITATPFSTEGDKLSLWFIEYQLIGTTDPDTAEGWQWHQVQGGKIVLDPATVTPSTISGVMGYEWTGTQNEPKVDIENPQFFGIIISIP